MIAYELEKNIKRLHNHYCCAVKWYTDTLYLMYTRKVCHVTCGTLCYCKYVQVVIGVAVTGTYKV